MAEHYSSEDSTKTCMAEYNDARENNLVSEFPGINSLQLNFFNIINIMKNAMFASDISNLYSLILLLLLLL